MKREGSVDREVNPRRSEKLKRLSLLEKIYGNLQFEQASYFIPEDRRRRNEERGKR